MVDFNNNIKIKKMNIDRSNSDQYPDFIRASGNCICDKCGKEYRKHPFDYDYLDWDGYPYLHKLCNGTLVKL